MEAGKGQVQPASMGLCILIRVWTHCCRFVLHWCQVWWAQTAPTAVQGARFRYIHLWSAMQRNNLFYTVMSSSTSDCAPRSLWGHADPVISVCLSPWSADVPQFSSTEEDLDLQHKFKKVHEASALAWCKSKEDWSCPLFCTGGTF